MAGLVLFSRGAWLGAFCSCSTVLSAGFPGPNRWPVWGVGELDASVRNDVQLAAIGMRRAPGLYDKHLSGDLLVGLDKT